MKKLVLIAALSVALAGCDDAAEEADDPATAETQAVAEETSAGTYEFEMDGKATVAVLNPDGTYTDTQGGEVIESGSWEDRDDGKVCFDSEGGDDTVVCYTLGEAAEDGTQTATPDNGSETLTVRKTA